MRRKLLSLTLVLITAAGLGVAVTGTAGASPYCGITWGSLAKSRATTASSSLTNVRAGQHTCFDRLVLDFAGRTPASTVRYVSGVPYQAQSGTIPLRGGAFLEIVVSGPAYDPNTGQPTYRFANRNELVNVTGWRTFRQVAFGGSFEGYTTIGLGVRARLPFRVFTLAGPGTGSRLVIDVAHRW
jgi:hypothetical protein